jgi:hypothetical protein
MIAVRARQQSTRDKSQSFQSVNWPPVALLLVGRLTDDERPAWSDETRRTFGRSRRRAEASGNDGAVAPTLRPVVRQVLGPGHNDLHPIAEPQPADARSQKVAGTGLGIEQRPANAGADPGTDQARDAATGT